MALEAMAASYVATEGGFMILTNAQTPASAQDRRAGVKNFQFDSAAVFRQSGIVDCDYPLADLRRVSNRSVNSI